MTTAPFAMASRRRCAHCLRPESACLCAWITPVSAGTELLILQHPMEVDEAKGSARLLHLSLPGSRVMVGEQFDEAALVEALGGGRHNLLLYPDDTADTDASKPVLTGRLPLRLVLLDGTWRKSRKMLHLNPLLQALPRLSLDEVPASRYLVRKAHRAGQLSTLEASCLALAQLEGRPDAFTPLLAAFDGFVNSQLARAGRVP